MKNSSRLFVVLMALLTAVVLTTSASADVAVLDSNGNVTLNGTTITPAGFLVIVVDGVETVLDSGSTYWGDIDVYDLDGEEDNYYESASLVYRSALHVENGVKRDDKSAEANLVGGSYGAQSVDGVSITATSGYYNGVTIVGTDFTVNNMVADFSGDGGNDMAGRGMAISIFDPCEVVIEGSDLFSSGTARSLVFIGSDEVEDDMPVPAVVTIKDTDIYAYGTKDEKSVDNATAVWMLGLYGDVRAMQYVGYFDVTYDNVSIGSAGWAVISVDDVDPPTATALEDLHDAYDEDAAGAGEYAYGDLDALGLIETYYWSGRNNVRNSEMYIIPYKDGGWGSGYGAYAIGANLNIFDHTRISNVDYASILANEYASVEFINHTVVDSNKYVVMSHSNAGGVIYASDSVLNSAATTFVLKGAENMFGVSGGLTLDVANCQINPGNGVILQVMDNDDNLANDAYYGMCMKMDDTRTEKDEDWDVTASYVYMQNSFMGGGEGTNYYFNKNVVANFSDVKLVGDLYNSSNHYAKNMTINLDHATVTGAISATEAYHDIDVMLKSMDIFDGIYVDDDGTRLGNRNELGNITNVTAPVVNNGVIVNLTNGSVWMVTETCYISSYSVDGTSKIKGRIYELEDGTYKVEPIGKKKGFGKK